MIDLRSDENKVTLNYDDTVLDSSNILRTQCSSRFSKFTSPFSLESQMKYC
jgi:hypothetical protein